MIFQNHIQLQSNSIKGIIVKGYDLFKAVKSNIYGFDPKIVGVNFARMGKDIQFVKEYFSVEYGEGFLTDLLEDFNRV